MILYETPIVDVIKASLIKSPLIVLFDFSFSNASNTALKFNINLSSGKDLFPILKPMFPSLSFLISTCPDFASVIAFYTLFVTYPNFGFGINPFGPRTFPNFESLIIIPGVQINFSKFILPDFIFSISSSPPTTSAPASFAS